MFVRLLLLRLCCAGARLSVVALQHRRVSPLGRLLAYFVGDFDLYTQSPASVAELRGQGIAARLIRSGVNTKRFHPKSNNRPHPIRTRYNIPEDSFLVLHVGHLSGSRNLGILKHIKQHAGPGTEVMLVASTSTRHDGTLEADLKKAGVIVHNEFVEDIADIYRAADCYLFPVVDSTGAIGAPLSVLEALACGTPVLTTPFGGLRWLVPEGPGIFYFKDETDVMEGISALRRSRSRGSDLQSTHLKLDWSHVFEEAFSS